MKIETIAPFIAFVAEVKTGVGMGKPSLVSLVNERIERELERGYLCHSIEWFNTVQAYLCFTPVPKPLVLLSPPD